MNKLRNKVFFLLLIILTIFLSTILLIYNYTLYNKEYESIKEQIVKMETTHNNFFPKKEIPFNDKKPILIDSIIYVVSFDNNMNIIEIINYSDNGLTELEIKTLAEDYISNNNYKLSKLKNLYFNKYLYSYKNNNLFIIDTKNTNTRLLSSLLMSIILFILLEIIIIIVDIKITKWLVEPVQDAFLKQKQFICDASHELKTPLSVIIASAETLEENPTEKKWLTTIQNEAERMSKLVVDLLDLAKSENDTKEEYEINNLSKIIEIATLPFESLIFEKGLKLNLEIEKNIKFACNPEKIKQLIGILVDNAIKHSIEKSKITVSLKTNNNNIIIEVINRGEEISKDERNKIFERFYRADSSRNRRENRYGLGLAIAKNIVINHKGNILVHCENGYTTFVVIFKQTKGSIKKLNN